MIEFSHYQGTFDLAVKTSINELPDALLAEILLKLPKESVFRSKLVSRWLLSVISDASFARAYIAQQAPSWCFIYARLKDTKLAWFHYPPAGFNSSSGFSFDFLRTSNAAGRFKILACDHGLLLLISSTHGHHHSHQQHRKFHVCNPLTMELVSLPPPQCEEEWAKVGFVVENDGSFWVVRVAPFFSPTECLDFEVFSSTAGEWRCLKVRFPCPLGFFVIARAVVHKGIAHWLAEADQIVAFDPRNDTDQCRVIASPGNHQRRIAAILGVSCGSLRYCQLSDTYHEAPPHRRLKLSTWVLADYEGGEWWLEDEASLSDIWPNNEYVDGENGVYLSIYGMFPEAFHPLDTNVVFLKCNGLLLAYTISTRNLELAARELCLGGSISEWQSFTFVLPSWPTPVPIPTWGEKGL